MFLFFNSTELIWCRKTAKEIYQPFLKLSWKFINILLFFFLFLFLSCSLSAQEVNLRKVSNAFIKKYSYQKNAEIQYNVETYKKNKDTTKRKQTVCLSSNYSLKRFFISFSHMYIKKEDKEYFIDSKEDSLYIKNKYMGSKSEKFHLLKKYSWVKKINRENPFFQPENFFRNIRFGKITSETQKRGKKIVEVVFRKQEPITIIEYTWTLNLTDTVLINYRHEKVQEHPCISHIYTEAKYKSMRKDVPSMDYEVFKQEFLNPDYLRKDKSEGKDLIKAYNLNSQINKKLSAQARESSLLLVGLGNDIWLNNPENVNIRIFSPSLNFAIMYDRPFAYTRFSLAIGLGMQSNNLYADSYLAKHKNAKKMTFYSFPDSINVSKYKINTSYFELPIELRLRLGKYHSGILAVGFKFGYLIHSHTKYKGDNYKWRGFQSKEKIKRKEYNIPNLRKFRSAVTMRITSNERNIGLWGQYNLNPLFKGNKLLDKNKNIFDLSLLTIGMIIGI